MDIVMTTWSFVSDELKSYGFEYWHVWAFFCGVNLRNHKRKSYDIMLGSSQHKPFPRSARVAQ